MKAYRILLIILAISFLAIPTIMFQSCKRSTAIDVKSISVNSAFKQYIEGFTTGSVSSNSGIIIRLNFDVADSTMINQTADPTLFSITPNIKGVTHWIDARTYRFQPEDRLPQNQSFIVNFHLSKLIKVPDSLKTLEFAFYTIKQDFEIVIESSKPYSNSNLTKEKLVGHILTADIENIDKIKSIISAKQDGKILPVSWTQESNMKKHIFTIDSITRSDKSSIIEIIYVGKSINVSTSGIITHNITPISDFKVVEIETKQHPEQLLIVRFSDPLNESQDFEGKITMGDFNNYSYIIDGNELRIYPTSYLKQKEYITLSSSIENINGKKLQSTHRELIEFENINPNVRFVADGVILPSSNGMIIPFEAINLKAVDVKVIRVFQQNIPQFLQINKLSETYQISRVGRTVLKKTIPLDKVPNYNRWNKFYIDLSTLIKAEQGAIYSVEISFRKQHSALVCDDETNVQSDNLFAFYNEAGDVNDDNWDNNSYNYYDDDYYDYYDYNWRDRDNPCSTSYYYNKSIKTNILATDIGLLAKKGETDELYVFANNLVTAEPMINVEIDVLNFQLQSLGKSKTDNEGKCVIPIKNNPYLVIAKKEQQQSYLKMGQSNMLSVSSFDVSGERVQKGIKGFIYAERGVWRPGDSLFVSFMLEDSKDNFPSHHPIIFELYNPLGNLIEKRTVSNSLHGIYSFFTKTDIDAPTGLYRLIVRVGKNTFYHSLRIEAIKPNRLKIDVNPGSKTISLSDVKQFTIESQWLHGAIAKNLKVESDVTFVNIKTVFSRYPRYSFDDPGKIFSSERVSFFSGQLNENGKVNFMPKFNINNASGYVRANIETRVYEPGGEHSIDFLAVDISPYTSYVGIMPPEKNNSQSYLFTNRTNVFNIINIKENQSPVTSAKVEVEVYKLEWRYWWNSYDNDATSFMNSSNMSFVSKSDVQINDGRGQFSLNIENNDWGRYFIKVIDNLSGHTSGTVEFFDWYGYNRFAESNKTAAAMLTLSTDKEKYTVGDNITMSFMAPRGSRAYVNIENGTEVLRTFLVSEKNGNIDFSVKAEQYMAPNIYLSVSLIQPHENTIDGLPIRLYGVIPVFVEDPSTILHPVINSPQVMRPEQTANIAVSEKNGKPMTYTLAIVDEGLLNLTRFKTPCPHSHFYAREALGVKYWDIYNDVIGAWGGQILRILSIGGDGDVEIDPSGQRANRFKPMVHFTGPFELKGNSTNTHTIRIPEYIGSVRIMVVAKDNKKYGNAEKSVPVKSPLMITGTAPRIIGPKETFRVPVSVFATESNVKNVDISIKTNNLFKITSGNSRKIRFDKTGEQLVHFDIEVAESIGIGEISVTAVSGSNRSEWKIELDVRPSNPRITNVISATIAEGNTWNNDCSSIGIAGTNTNVLEVSTFIPMDIDKWLNHLINYPHGCAEQTISGAFAMLYIETLSQASDNAKKKAEQKIKHAIARIQSMQLTSGGIAMWPGSNFPDDWTTSYAGHFIAEAQQKGYVVSKQFISRWQSYQQLRARRWRRDKSIYNNDLTQAYRLYSLAINESAEIGAMNNLSENSFLTPQSKWLLAATYSIIGRNDIAMNMSKSNTTNISNYIEYGYTYGSGFRDKAFILETFTRLNMSSQALEILKEIATELSSRAWLSTQASAQALRSVAFYLTKYPMGNQMNFDYTHNNKSNSVTSKNMTHTIELGDMNKHKMSVKNTGKGTLYTRIIQSGIPLESSARAFQNNIQMTVNYKDLNGRTINPNSITQGTIFFAEVNIKHPGILNNYKSMALTHIFPSGWEIMSDRFMFDNETNSGFTYQDIRDDRVITYFDIDKNKSITIRVRLSASYVGNFYMPIVYCEAMYNNQVSALIPGRWVKVTDAMDEK